MRDVPIPNPSPSSRLERRILFPISNMAPAQFLRLSRERLALRYREAQSITEEVAAELGNLGYAIALGSLSDYEASNTLPRQIRKIVSLSIAYAFDLGDYLGCAGVDLRDQGRRRVSPDKDEPLPSAVLSAVPLPVSTSTTCPIPVSLVQGFMRSMYPAESLAAIEYYSESDIGPHGPAALFVDRSCTALERALWPAPWHRPVYLIRHRGGHYLHGFCTITDGLMTVHHSRVRNGAATSYPRGDVEIIGRVVAVVKNRETC
jgi:hypothetical protein